MHPEAIMRSGGCLCETVRYEVRGPLGQAVFCHCSRCRKASGSVVAFNAPVRASDLVVIAGADAVKSFDAPAVRRFFCAECGSQLYSQRTAAPEILRLRLGTLDTPPESGPQAHIFFASQINL